MGRISIFELFSWFVFRKGRKKCCLRVYLGNLNLSNNFLKGKENEKTNDFCAGNGIEPVIQ